MSLEAGAVRLGRAPVQLAGGWEISLLVLLVALYAVGSILNPTFFGGADAFHSLLRDTARYGVMAAVISGFGRVISEVGCALMVGGNIEGQTRTITTAIALETSKGEFAQGIALGIVLVSLALLMNGALVLLQGEAHTAGGRW